MTAPFPQEAYEIVTPRLIIRSATPDDAEGLYKLMSTPENQPFEEPQRDLSPEVMRARIERWKPMTAAGKNAFMMVTLRETGEIIGQGGYNCFEDASGASVARQEGNDVTGRPYLTDTGVVLDHRHWGKGYGRETLCAKVDYAMEELGCSVVRVETGDENKPWRALMASVGLDRIETKGPTSYDANIIGWVYNIDAQTWKSVRENLKLKGKWPL
ncbi:putative N-acetyltransferase p20 [Colletotrichum orbiculare MAFF 240422]|uniref:N-acetyltransferase p20 n=1 Tax=Colletotrichum orbiculare (strain 104-T / ATCC 96160 / CBS 514.97 / LARS 414 / MAFF 240422) TaxID=1213857 RepID=N4VAZ7_COLOR|nr:putative N-acetyltransferase p20 [Colletotrichum orbiculare MAFF 240422]